MALLSVVIPSYNEEENIARTIQVLSDILQRENILYELIFISDGSKDRTFELIEEASRKDSRVKGAQFSRNFGKEASIFAGLSLASGDCCVVMDVMIALPEKNTFFRALSFWTGFRSATVSYEVAERAYGESKWSFASLIKYAISNITSLLPFRCKLSQCLA